ncbi:MAG: hypothetical protein KC468_33920 [Myxococcales bacterium]|nr:hypothetical protein [Myxococcales bacterium]
MDFDDDLGGVESRARGRGRLGRVAELAAPFVATVSLAGACSQTAYNPPLDTEATSTAETTEGAGPTGTSAGTEPGATDTMGSSGSGSASDSSQETVNPPITTGSTEPGTSDATTSATTGSGTSGTTDGGATSDTGGGFDPGDDGVQLCGDDYPMDEVAISNSALNGDTLTLMIGYSGGCEEHAFGLCWDGLFLESEPVQVNLALAHDGMGDACEAFVMEEIALDLTPLKQAYQDAYQTDTGTITIHVGGLQQPVSYSF